MIVPPIVCLCPAMTEYDPICPAHGLQPIGVTPSDSVAHELTHDEVANALVEANLDHSARGGNYVQTLTDKLNEKLRAK